ncbi:hypothetical protein ACIQWA_26125 [Kitasatospora sp. NPDC098652]|uniref:hypothetical protein n=1 Tax=Kitasatospora sp. NPDC098652 TaxID=3364095 RepID=UPI00380784F2
MATTDGGSWAAVDWDGTRGAERYTVWQHGPRRLWEEVEGAYRWWLENGRPGPERFGLTVTPDGQWVWLDKPRAGSGFAAQPALQETDRCD